VPLLAMGIGSALIATLSSWCCDCCVILYNSFQSVVKRNEDDFQLLKLLFLSFSDSEQQAKNQQTDLSFNQSLD
jgi:biopolymer transport protein ExbB